MADEFGKGRDTELILAPGLYAFVLDETKGHINTLCGPIKQSLSNTDRLVTYDPRSERYIPTDRQSSAITNNIIAAKGCYIVLKNPAANNKQPEPGKAEVMPIGTLSYGRTENIPGPQSFPLWPGQIATVIPGHHLRSNQYLLVRVYDDEAAKANWDKSVVKHAATETKPDKTETVETAETILGDKNSLVTGQLIIIKGTDISFYIPPTGIEVLQEDGSYVRDAVTLERLEYSILLDENGNKEYRRGPDVVFPSPTQQFYTREGTGGQILRKFRAFELQPTNGIHIKVIADYDDGEKHYTAGDELFITGAECSIYYPREEHAIISYGGNEKTYAVAIPAGEGRYVLDRKTGNVKLVTGPAMFLPNPIKEVIVRRKLSRKECDLYYPGNAEVVRHNDQLAADGIDAASDPATINAAIARGFRPAQNEYEKVGAFADRLARSTAYTPPRMITLDTKFDGAVKIGVYSGFAVQVVNSKGKRRTVIGPQTVLLEYDEYLERLSLSTRTPKTSDVRIETPYLRYISNSVSDLITLKTQDLTNVEVRVKYLVRFDEAQSDNWFSVDNYVQYMVDHLRSLIGNAVRGIGVQDFYINAATILRNVVLGEKGASDERPLHHFEENGMTVYDLELISVVIRDDEVAKMLAAARQEALKEAIDLDRAQRRSALVAGLEEASREQLEEKAETQILEDKIKSETLARQGELDKLQQTLQTEFQVADEQAKKAVLDIVIEMRQLELQINKAERELQEVFETARSTRVINQEKEFAEAQKIRLAALAPALVEALTALAQSGQFQSMAEHLAPLSIVRGESLAGTLEHLLDGTPLEKVLRNIQSIGKVAPQIASD